MYCCRHVTNRAPPASCMTGIALTPTLRTGVPTSDFQVLGDQERVVMVLDGRRFLASDDVKELDTIAQPDRSSNESVLVQWPALLVDAAAQLVFRGITSLTARNFTGLAALFSRESNSALSVYEAATNEWSRHNIKLVQLFGRVRGALMVEFAFHANGRRGVIRVHGHGTMSSLSSPAVAAVLQLLRRESSCDGVDVQFDCLDVAAVFRVWLHVRGV